MHICKLMSFNFRFSNLEFDVIIIIYNNNNNNNNNDNNDNNNFI